MFKRNVFLKVLAVLLFAGVIGRSLAADQQVDPSEITDTLERAKAKGMLKACADPYDYPYSLQNSDPPGFDIELIREVAKRGGMRLDIFWINTATRGGTSRAFRNSILTGKCDVLLGLS
ncbi:MAG: hypothetical protein AB7S36_21485, partial [Planctomycetota bacterium]